jgi:crotonobetainyl-CoA:carnitine CoA-transferase CaiB-like acyl-CoA transferase
MMRPLEGIIVLDMTVYQHGPYSTTMLADLGADVVKIEEPGLGDPGRFIPKPRSDPHGYFEANNRNKRSVTLDLKHELGKQALYRLVPRADVFVQNMRVGVAERLGVGYATLFKLNPRLVYASASGYGPKGPHARWPTLDIAAQARGGMMSVMGEADRAPGWVGVPVADQAGAIILSYAIVTALLVRERTGIGQEVNTSLLGSQVCMQAWNIADYLITDRAPGRAPRERRSALWNVYKCADRWIVIGVNERGRNWQQLCAALGRDDLIDDPRFATPEVRGKNRAELMALFDAIFATLPADDWLERLAANNVVAGPVNNYADVARDPQVLENDYIVEIDHPSGRKLRVVGFPVRFSKTPAVIQGKAPGLGEHTDEVLRGLGGYTDEEIARLRAEKVI